MKERNNSKSQPSRTQVSPQKGEQYEQLFYLLSQEDAELTLSNSFPTAVGRRLQSIKEQHRKEHIILSAGLLLLVIVAVIALAIWGNVATKHMFSIDGVYWYAVIFLVLAGVFKWIEKRFMAYS